MLAAVVTATIRWYRWMVAVTTAASMSRNSGWSPTVSARERLRPISLATAAASGVEVVQHLDMVDKETDRGNHCRADPAPGHSAQGTRRRRDRAKGSSGLPLRLW